MTNDPKTGIKVDLDYRLAHDPWNGSAEFSRRDGSTVERSPELAFGIEGFQVQSIRQPGHKLIRLLTPVGPFVFLATQKCLLDLGRATIEGAEASGVWAPRRGPALNRRGRGDAGGLPPGRGLSSSR
jgi:hypothetical protein